MQNQSTSFVNNPYNQVKKTGIPSTYNNNTNYSTTLDRNQQTPTSNSNHHVDEIDHKELESIICLINDRDHHLSDHYNTSENLKNHQYYQEILLSSNCTPQLERQKQEEIHNMQQQLLYSPPRHLSEYKQCNVLSVGDDEEEQLLLHDLFFICN
ncbi:unnamed protein product [Trichobilharzia regenti]|nr:unnamed protein product [Trichobilharzia regenti]